MLIVPQSINTNVINTILLWKRKKNKTEAAPIYWLMAGMPLIVNLVKQLVLRIIGTLCEFDGTLNK